MQPTVAPHRHPLVRPETTTQTDSESTPATNAEPDGQDVTTWWDHEEPRPTDRPLQGEPSTHFNEESDGWIHEAPYHPPFGVMPNR